MTIKHNLKVYNQILDRSIHSQKQKHYYHQFEKFQSDSKKTWDVIRSVLNMNKSKKDFPLFFLIDNKKETNRTVIAERFNTFFTNIGTQLAEGTNKTSSRHFSTYLTQPIRHRFSFSLTNQTEVSKILNDFKPKTSSGHDKFSMKLIKQSLPC